MSQIFIGLNWDWAGGVSKLGLTLAGDGITCKPAGMGGGNWLGGNGGGDVGGSSRTLQISGDVGNIKSSNPLMAITMVSCDGDEGAALGSGLNERQGDECILPHIQKLGLPPTMQSCHGLIGFIGHW